MAYLVTKSALKNEKHHIKNDENIQRFLLPFVTEKSKILIL